MKFYVLKSSVDGIGGAAGLYAAEEALREVFCSKGWASIGELKTAVSRWMATAKPGDVFTTAVTAIVCAGCGSPHAEGCNKCLSSDVEWHEFDPVENGNVEQRGECRECGHFWCDVYSPAERRTLKKGGA